jgi:endonuclease/exonuclease/phosphatase family metal-dependent hydrolase
MSRWLLAALFVSMLGLSLHADDAPPIRVMSFNIRYGTAKDGENHWDKRKEFLVETIKAFDPDLLGTQETLGFQRDYIREHLPGYEVLGVGRNDGKEDGEMMALYFRKDRFEATQSGHFWLSDAPETIGSKSWDSSLPRMVTWVQLRDRQQPEAKPITFFNTHFDHMGQTARLESARLIRSRVAKAAADGPVIVTGDFNAGEGSPPYTALFGQADGQDSPVIDSYRATHPEASKEEGTFSGFKAGQMGGARIDWIAVTRDWKIGDTKIDRTARDGRTPSDHYPITTVLTRP